MAVWRPTLARRTAEAERAAALRSRALAFAERAAEVLRVKFGAGRVVLFGSLAHGRWFGERSDIDLAVEGLDADGHLVAIARLTEMAGGLEIDLEIDIVRLERCSADLRTAIDREGRSL